MCSVNLLVKLSRAIQTYDIESVRSILLKNPEVVNTTRDIPQGMCSPLWEAMICGYEEIIEILIDFGADVNEKYIFEKNYFYNRTYLQCLSFFNNWESSQKVGEILISRGADVNASLPLAIKQGHVECVEFLLKNKSKLDSTSVVLDAPKTTQKEILKLLIKYVSLDLNGHSKNANDLLF